MPRKLCATAPHVVEVLEYEERAPQKHEVLVETSFASGKHGTTTAMFDRLNFVGQDFDQDSGIREQMRRLAAHLVFPRFKEHIDFWADKGLVIYQIPEVIARDALQGWFYLDIPPRPMPPPKFLLKEDS